MSERREISGSFHGVNFLPIQRFLSLTEEPVNLFDQFQQPTRVLFFNSLLTERLPAFWGWALHVLTRITELTVSPLLPRTELSGNIAQLATQVVPYLPRGSSFRLSPGGTRGSVKKRRLTV